MSVEVRDRSRVHALRAALAESRSLAVEVGVFGDDDSHLLMVARVHEFGCEIEVTPKMRAWFRHQGYPLKATTTHINIPERSYLRSGFDEALPRLNEMVSGLGQLLIAGRITPRQLCERLGEWMASRIRERIRAITEPPLHPMTIEHKPAGATEPLIATGRLRQSITYRVVTVT